MEIWQMMPGKPEGYEGLESRAEVLGDLVMDSFDKKLKRGEVLLDEDFDMEHPELVTLTDMLATCLDNTYDMACQNSHAGFMLGIFVASQLVDKQEFGLYMGDFYDQSPKDLSQKLFEAPQIYLGWRPNLDKLISRYVVRVSSNTECRQLVEQTAALACIHVEQSLFSQFVGQKSRDFLAGLPDKTT